MKPNKYLLLRDVSKKKYSSFGNPDTNVATYSENKNRIWFL